MPLWGCSLAQECQHPFFLSPQPSCILPLQFPELVYLLHLWLWWPRPSSQSENLPCSAPHPPAFRKYHPQQMACTSSSVWLLLPEDRLIGYSFFSPWSLLLPPMALNSCIYSFVQQTYYSVPAIHSSVSGLLSSLCTQLDLTYLSLPNTHRNSMSCDSSIPGRMRSWVWQCHLLFPR